MAKFRKKPVVIEAITFDELVDYGRANGANIVNGGGRRKEWDLPAAPERRTR